MPRLANVCEPSCRTSGDVHHRSSQRDKFNGIIVKTRWKFYAFFILVVKELFVRQAHVGFWRIAWKSCWRPSHVPWCDEIFLLGLSARKRLVPGEKLRVEALGIGNGDCSVTTWQDWRFANQARLRLLSSDDTWTIWLKYYLAIIVGISTGFQGTRPPIRIQYRKQRDGVAGTTNLEMVRLPDRILVIRDCWMQILRLTLWCWHPSSKDVDLLGKREARARWSYRIKIRMLHVAIVESIY